MIKRYKMICSYNDMPEGTLVYDSAKYDYGCSSDDTRITGVKHISVTFKENGDYPFFTIPKYILEEINE